jgi:hypothetical protein
VSNILIYGTNSGGRFYVPAFLGKIIGRASRCFCGLLDSSKNSSFFGQAAALSGDVLSTLANFSQWC